MPWCATTTHATQPDEREKIVFGFLGYDYLWFRDIDRAEECKRGIATYFQRVPAGQIVLKKRSEDDPRKWDDVLTVTQETMQELFDFIDTEVQKSQAETLEKQGEEERGWADLLREAGREMPRLPR